MTTTVRLQSVVGLAKTDPEGLFRVSWAEQLVRVLLTPEAPAGTAVGVCTHGCPWSPRQGVHPAHTQAVVRVELN